MDMTVSVDALFGWIAGPTGAIILSVVILWWLGTGIKALMAWLGDKLDKWVDRGFSQVDEMIKQGKRDRELYEESATKDREIDQSESTLDREMHKKYMGELVTELKAQGEMHREKLDSHEIQLNCHKRKLDEILDHVKNG